MTIHYLQASENGASLELESTAYGVAWARSDGVIDVITATAGVLEEFAHVVEM
ncbi:hypothetical protein C0993_011032 [Termitomyces sp. T159_Od127]|nr:hypothetical protein C0993_011032 [Termitomyces sp. T159_Od127]